MLHHCEDVKIVFPDKTRSELIKLATAFEKNKT